MGQLLMNDEQLVSALIASYKSRGVDMSYLLSDPLFTKLPGPVQIRAIQDHSEELEAGINGSFNKREYVQIGAEAGYNGFKGAVMGASVGAALAHQFPGPGIGPLKAALMAAGLLGLTGASVGAFKASGGAGHRKALKTSLRTVSVDPSPINAVGPLSISHITSDSRSLKKEILDRIGKDINDQAHSAVPNWLSNVHQSVIYENS